MMDRSRSDVQVVLTYMDISAEDFTQLFFDHCFCENGLPLKLISDRDKLFVSHFWKQLTKVTGVKLGMSTAFHPETDGASEHMNKTVNQCLRYHVMRNQKGWAWALPHIQFTIMNTINKSAGFSPFQLNIEWSPWLIPPITPVIWVKVAVDTVRLVNQIHSNVTEAKDNLMLAKVFQADQANRKRGLEDTYSVNNLIMLSTANQRKKYASTGSGHSTKLFPRHDNPYRITKAFPQTPTYQLNIPNTPPNFCFTFHTSQLKHFVPNNWDLFPGQKLPWDGLVVLPSRQEEHVIKRILDERRWGREWQYLVQWKGYGPGDNKWMLRWEV